MRLCIPLMIVFANVNTHFFSKKKSAEQEPNTNNHMNSFSFLHIHYITTGDSNFIPHY
jgi:hypothetical protein